MEIENIERLLPGLFQRTLLETTPLAALTEVMSRLQQPSEDILANLDAYLDPRRAPPDFVQFLARWVHLNIAITTGLPRLRELVANAVELSKWRGTARGLLKFLETAAGETGFDIRDQIRDSVGRIRPFHVEINAPSAVRDHAPMLRQIIELEKPAYVTYELVFPPPGSTGNSR